MFREKRKNKKNLQMHENGLLRTQNKRKDKEEFFEIHVETVSSPFSNQEISTPRIWENARSS